MKRKTAIVTDRESVPDRALKKLKVAEDDGLERSSSRIRIQNHSFNPAIGDGLEASVDDSQLNYTNMAQHGQGQYTSALPFSKREAHRKSSALTHDMRRRLLNEQVSFIIITRDNNIPNRYGKRSAMQGPLPWPAVAELYNEKYHLSVGPAAMEKRARYHRSAWLESHPGYPTEITYTQKLKESRAVSIKGVRVMEQKFKNKGKRTNTGRAKRAAVGGWHPPNNVANLADINNYTTSLLANTHQDEYAHYITIEVVDAKDELLGMVKVDAKDLANSSAWYREELEHNMDVRARLVCSSVTVVEHLVQCISPVLLSKLPELEWVPTVLFELYSVAAVLGDIRVRDLIMDYWRMVLRKHNQLELCPAEVNNLFQSTEFHDPARTFWVAVLHGLDMSSEILHGLEWHSTLIARVEQLRTNKRFQQPWLLQDAEFCRRFHNHARNQACHWEQ